MSSKHNAELVRVLADALEAENVRCKISLWQKDESGYGFGPLGDPCPINLDHLAEFCVGVLRQGWSVVRSDSWRLRSDFDVVPHTDGTVSGG